jgi:polyphenol oxidase
LDAGADGIAWLEAEVPHPYRLVFTNRRGGVSEAPYDTLNLGFKTGDDPSRVMENRLRVCGALGQDLDDWTLVRQVHSSRVMEVDGHATGAGSRGYFSGLGEADAMVTREGRAVLCILTADCVPVALYGGEPHAMALVHSGWKGTLAGIAGAAVEEMRRRFGTRPEELRATLGPGIRSCCYRVEGERAASFREAFGEAGEPEETGLELFRAIRFTLEEKGIKQGNIVDTGICTRCDRDYFSFRRDGTTGRQAALLWTTGGKGKL